MRNSRTGSSTLEFIFCAPLLVILMFVAMEINERLEQRVTLAIAGGNAAWISKPEVGTNGELGSMHSLVTADILGLRSGSGAALGIRQATMAATGAETILSYTETKSRADTYFVSIQRDETDNAQRRLIDRSGAKLGDSQMDATMSNVSSLAANLMRTWDRLANFAPLGLSAKPFPSGAPEEIKVTWGVNESHSQNLLLKSISQLAKGIDRAADISSFDSASTNNRLLAHKTYYIKRDAGYHPESYQLQAAMGMGLGSCQFDNFNDKCFMNLGVNPRECGETNNYIDYLYRIYATVVLGKTLVDVGVIACIVASIGTGSVACKIPQNLVMAAEKALTKAELEYIEKVLKDAVKESMGQVINAVPCSDSNTLIDGMQGLFGGVGNATQGLGQGLFRR
jgi:hypothetical protein